MPLQFHVLEFCVLQLLFPKSFGQDFTADNSKQWDIFNVSCVDSVTQAESQVTSPVVFLTGCLHHKMNQDLEVKG